MTHTNIHDSGGARIVGVDDPTRPDHAATKQYVDGKGTPVDVTDGSTTVTGIAELDFTSGATVTDAGGGVAQVALGGSQPDGISGLALWLDAATFALADDDPVTTWPDLSGNGFDATQGSVNETQSFYVEGTGNFTLAVDKGEGSVTIALAQSNDLAAIEAAFLAQGITVSASGGPLGGGYVSVEFLDTWGNTSVTLVFSSNDPGITTTDAAQLIEGGTADSPTFKTAVVNGLPVVRFDGSSGLGEWLDLTGAGLALLQDVPGVTVAAVVSSASAASYGVFHATDGLVRASGRVELTSLGTFLLEGKPDDGGSATSLAIGIDDSNTNDRFVTIIGACNFAAGTDLIGSAAEAASPDPPTPPQWTPMNTSDTPSIAVSVGRDWESGLLTGDIAELVVYSRALNTKERREVVEYLSAKWATL